jgi:4-amino-4-deoxy-L-arabinose transferase-like glycosyltransferase
MSEKAIKISLTAFGILAVVLLNGLFSTPGQKNSPNPIFSMLLLAFIIGVWRWKKKGKDDFNIDK